MLRKIEHLGIAVKSIDDSLKTFETLLGSKCYKIEEVASATFFKKILSLEISAYGRCNIDNRMC